MVTLYLIIKGKVQGVFYRASANEQALALGLTGWVKNTTEGHVEAVVSGEQETVDLFIEWCKKGPSKAVVTAVEISQVPLQDFDDFTVKR